MDTTELGVSMLLKSWLWCLVAVLTACVLEQWIPLALLGCVFVANDSQRSSRYFSFMLPRFSTKDRIILLITELKNKTNQNESTHPPPPPSQQAQQKTMKAPTHQVLALITDKALGYFGLQDKSLRLACDCPVNQKQTGLQTTVSVASAVIWTRENLLWLITASLVAPRQNILSFAQRSLVGWLPCGWILLLPAFDSLQDEIVNLSRCKWWQLFWSLTKNPGKAGVTKVILKVILPGREDFIESWNS